jgi:hypothetical protein
VSPEEGLQTIEALEEIEQVISGEAQNYSVLASRPPKY